MLSSAVSCNMLAMISLGSQNLLADNKATLIGCSRKGPQEYFLFCHLCACNATLHAFWIVTKSFLKFGNSNFIFSKKFFMMFFSSIKTTSL
ncbi:MAG: hypothetical protein WCG25_00495 [bacterium]